MKNWLKSGRCVWYISGNCGHKEAIDIVERAKESLSLDTVAIEDLRDVRCIALEPKTSYIIEEPLQDKSNENSCAMVYYEVGL